MLVTDFNMKFYIKSVFKIILKITPHIHALWYFNTYIHIGKTEVVNLYSL